MMDIKIENKDITFDISDNIVEVSGIEQAVQQINLAMGVKKGSFIYDRSFGSEIHKSNLSSENIAKEMESLINEGLVNVEDVCVTVNSVSKILGRYRVDITVNNSYEEKNIEVVLNG